MNIELDAPNVGELEKKYLNEVIDNGFVSTFGPFIAQFERRIAEYLGVKAAVAVQSGTAAISIALHELGIGPGDEVIVPPLTFAATVNPILYVGATPVFVDVDVKTWNLDPKLIRRAVTKRTRAILPVHLYGNPCNMREIMDIAKEYGLYVVEDSTESLGARYDGRQTGSLGDFGCFSFNGNKLITTGGGGMVVSRDAGKIEHIRYLVNQAKDQDRPFFHSEMGFNYRMTNVEAALGMAQFERIGGFLEKKKLFKKIYSQAFAGLPFVRFQEQDDQAEECCWFACIVIDKAVDLPELMRKLKDRGVPSRRIFMPLGEMPYLKAYATLCPVAMDIYSRGLCLPSSTMNEEADVREAAVKIREVLCGQD